MVIALCARTVEAMGITWVDVAGVVVPTLAVFASVGLGVWTYRRQQQSKHRDQLRDLFSDALHAVADYQELPYLIRRRSDEAPMTRADLTRHASDVQTRLDYYVTRLELEGNSVGNAFAGLVSATRREAGEQMTQAWREARLAHDDDVPLGAGYTRDAADRSKTECILVMQRHLRTTTSGRKNGD